MKKLFSTAFIFVICTCPILAQDFQFGVKTGLNISTLDNEGSEIDTYKPQLGLMLGTFGALGISEKSSLKAELIFSMEGANYKSSNTYVRLNRLSLPLLYNYKLSPLISVEAGPELKYQIGFDSNFPSSQGNLKGLYENLDHGISIGVEISPISKFRLSLRNYFGMKYHSNYILTDENGNITERIKSDRSNVLTLAVNYYLKD